MQLYANTVVLKVKNVESPIILSYAESPYYYSNKPSHLFDLPLHPHQILAVSITLPVFQISFFSFIL